MNERQKKALKFGIASVKMEGFSFDEKQTKICYDLMSGKMSYKKFISECKHDNKSYRK